MIFFSSFINTSLSPAFNNFFIDFEAFPDSFCFLSSEGYDCAQSIMFE